LGSAGCWSSTSRVIPLAFYDLLRQRHGTNSFSALTALAASGSSRRAMCRILFQLSLRAFPK
jgi:hypothetical protein